MHLIVLAVVVIILFARAPGISIGIGLLLIMLAMAMLVAMQAGDVWPAGDPPDPSHVTGVACPSVVAIAAMTAPAVLLLLTLFLRSMRKH